MIRVFPRATKQTPDDGLAFVGDPPLFRPPDQPVKISVTFTWDIPEAERLLRAWSAHYSDVEVGGPAYGHPGGDFVGGRFLKAGCTITSRGCPNRCWFCFVPRREGKIRELPIVAGNIVQDNNLTACSWPHIESVFKMLQGQHRIKFAGGLEAARINDRWVELLRGINLREIFLAYDDPARDKVTEKALRKLSAAFSREKIRCFVLAGQAGDAIGKAIHRCEQVWEWGGMPFMMLYRDEYTVSPYSKEWKKAQHEVSGPWGSPEWRKAQKVFSRPAITKAYIRERDGA